MTLREAAQAFIDNKEYKSLATILIASGSLYGALMLLSSIF